jgi:hypothetical protein
MKELLRNRKVVISAGIVIVILVFGLIFVFTRNQSQNQGINAEPTPIPVLSLQPADIGLTLTAASNMQRATMKITKTGDITSVDYQLTYNALVSGQQTSRGTIGHIDVKTSGQTISQEMVFGTCSDVCHYDSGITDIKLIVKVTKTDGKIYQVEQALASE